MRLYSFTQGEILLNGIDLRQIDEKALRAQVACCPQEVQLFRGTMRENMTLFDGQYADAAILAAVDSLGLSPWFSNYPQGLDTYLTLGENTLSAGEAQLITIVRMALKNPALILLDEITAQLDSRAEERIVSALSRLCKGKTVLMISHRESAVRWMDRVLHMEQGRLTGERNGD